VWCRYFIFAEAVGAAALTATEPPGTDMANAWLEVATAIGLISAIAIESLVALIVIELS
jgi:hypothetical protein